MKTHLLLITDGRQDCLKQTMASAEAMLVGVPKSGTIIDDSCDSQYAAWLQERWPEYTVISSAVKLGFGGAIQKGWDNVPDDCSHVFHLEDDFTFNCRVDVEQMVAILEEAPHLIQLVLKRQPWNEAEKAAGGIVECWPDQYEEIETTHGAFTQHNLFFSTNPSVYRRSLTELGWPSGENSERRFTDQLVEDASVRFAFLGHKFDPPAVNHVGWERAGVGY